MKCQRCGYSSKDGMRNVLEYCLDEIFDCGTVLGEMGATDAKDICIEEECKHDSIYFRDMAVSIYDGDYSLVETCERLDPELFGLEKVNIFGQTAILCEKCANDVDKEIEKSIHTIKENFLVDK